MGYMKYMIESKIDSYLLNDNDRIKTDKGMVFMTIKDMWEYFLNQKWTLKGLLMLIAIIFVINFLIDDLVDLFIFATVIYLAYLYRDDKKASKERMNMKG